MIEIILTVCALSDPSRCEEQRLEFAWNGSTRQCMMAAQPYIAQWIGDHPKWVAKSWRCGVPGVEIRT